MQVFEFHFNPPRSLGFEGQAQNLVFDSFCHEPENIYERKMGGIFMLGELKHTLPHNFRLPERIAAVLKKEFYSKFHRSPEFALKESLRRANELLSAEVSKENTDWLGNLNFAILSLKNFELRFTKVGGIKIFLIRGPHLIDIGQKLDSQEIEPYPLKIFNNIVSGKLGENDVLIAVTEEIFPSIKPLISEIAKIFPFDPVRKTFSNGVDEKKLKDLIKTKEAEYALLSGALVLINIVKTQPAARRPKIIFQRETEKFSVWKALTPAIKNIRKIKNPLSRLNPLNFIKPRRSKGSGLRIEASEKTETTPPKPIKVQVKIENKIDKPPGKKFNFPRFNFPKIRIPSEFNSVSAFFTLNKNVKERLKRRWILIPIFFALLILGFFIFREQERQNRKAHLDAIFAIREKVTQAESMMILKDSNPQALETSNSALLKAWDEISLLVKTDNGKNSQAFALKEIIESDLINFNGLVKISNPLEAASNLFLQERQSDTVTFNGNFYSLDAIGGEIIKYSENMENPQLWLKNRAEVLGAKSIAVDGSVWILSGNNQILRYRAGVLQETIKPVIFPKAKDFSKIYITSALPYLFILEPEQKRIIMLQKTGQIFKQFQSEKFDNLLDLSVSVDGKTLYILNSQKVYKISL